MNHPTRNALQDSNIIVFTVFLGLSILGYLNPLHSPIAHDYLPNAFSFICISLGLGLYFLRPNSEKIRLSYSITMWSWLSLALLLAVQPLLSHIRYPDSLIFPVVCLIVTALASLVANNITDKARFINTLTPFIYAMLALTFVIQVMQTLNYQITWQGWPATRMNALPDRMDGNFGQANHTAYAFLLGLCCVMYQLDHAKDKFRQVGLLILWSAFAVGIAVTKSRAVLIMLVAACLIYFFGQVMPWRRKFAFSIGLLALFAISYTIGSGVLASLSPDKVSATGGIGRITGTDSQRMYLLERGWRIFQESPLFGAGWNNYAFEGIKYVDSLSAFTFGDNAHNFVIQILAELGIVGLVCLLPIAWLLIKSIHFQHSSESAMALGFVVASVIYACFEYPLWYFRYLLLFAVFLALIEQKKYHFPAVFNEKSNGISSGFYKLVGIGCLGLFIASVYYTQTYFKQRYLFEEDMFYSVNDTEQSITPIHYEPPLFGFRLYGEKKLASHVALDSKAVADNLALLDRVLIYQQSPFTLFSYAKLLSYANKPADALIMFKAACRVSENADNCEAVESMLEELADKDPTHFQVNYHAYQAWLQRRNIG